MNPTERLSGLQSLFETALMLSRDNGGVPVLCENFLPWADIAVTADGIGWSGPSGDADQVRGRWEVMCWFLDRCVSRQPSDRMGLSHADIGRVDYWPTRLRKEAHQDMGPFQAVIECRNPLDRVVSPAH